MSDLIRQLMLKTVLKSARPKKRNYPTRNTPPETMDKKGISMWVEFFDKYDSVIKAQIKKYYPNATKEGDLGATKYLIAFFKNYCNKRGKDFFTNKTDKEKDGDASYMLKRFSSLRTKVKAKVKSVLKVMNRNGFLNRILVEKYDGIDIKTSNMIKILTSVTISTSVKFTDKNFRTAVIDNGFAVGKNRLFIEDKMYTLSIEPLESGEKSSKMKITIALKFTHVHLKKMVGLDSTSSRNDLDALDKKVSKIVKDELKTNKINSELIAYSIVGYVDETEEVTQINYESPLSEADQETLQNELANINGMPTPKIVATYNKEYLNAIGHPIFRYQLLRGIIDILGKRNNDVPFTYTEMIENPDSYLRG